SVAGRVHGPYGDVRIDAAASIRDFQILDVAVGDVSAQGEFADNVLSFSGLKGRKERSTYQGGFKLDFGREGTPVEARFELPDAYLHDLVEMAAGRMQALSAVANGANFDGHVSGMLEVKGPVGEPEAKATLSLASASFWRQRFDEGEARLLLHGRVPRLQIERLVLRRGDAELEASGGVGPDWRFDLDTITRGFTLADLDFARTAQLRGSLMLEGHLRGSAARPLVDVSARFAGARAGNAEVGEGKLAVRIDGAQMRWDVDVGTHRLAGQATLAGDFQYSTSLALRFPDLSGYFQTFVPEVDLQG